MTWDNGCIVIASPPTPATVMRVQDGHLVIPHTLPIHVRPEHHGIPVEVFFGIIEDTPATCE